MSGSSSTNYQKFLQEIEQNARNKVYLYAPLAIAYKHALTTVQYARMQSWKPGMDFLVKAIMDPPKANEEHMLLRLLASVMSQENPRLGYKDYFGDHEGIAMACIIDILNHLQTGSMGLEILQRVFEPWLEQKENMPVVQKWKGSVQLQAMLLLQRLITREESDEWLTKFLRILSLEALPRYRYIIEVRNRPLLIPIPLPPSFSL
jgi:hypothetical protein